MLKYCCHVFSLLSRKEESKDNLRNFFETAAQEEMLSVKFP